MSVAVLHASDLAFLDDLVAILHRTVRMSDVAASRTSDAAVRSLAHTISMSAGAQIAAIRSCLAETAAAQGSVRGVGTTSSMFCWMLSTEETEDLVHVADADFDAHYLRQLAGQQHAAVERSRSELVEGRSRRCRDFAENATSESTAGLKRIRELSAA